MKSDKIYEEFFRKLLGEADNLSAYVDSLYAGTEYTDDDLNHIFGVLKKKDSLYASMQIKGKRKLIRNG